MTNLLLTVAGLTIAALLSPGPNFVLISGRALTSGARPAMATAVGVATGTLTHALFGIAGVGALLRGSATLFTTAKLVGAAYLLWVGFKALRGAIRSRRAQLAANGAIADLAETAPRDRVGITRSAVDGYLTQMSNPKSTLFFLAMFTTVVPANTGIAEGAAVVGTVVTLALAGYIAIALIFSRRPFQLAYQRVGYVFDAVFGVLMVALGIRVALVER